MRINIYKYEIVQEMKMSIELIRRYYLILWSHTSSPFHQYDGLAKTIEMICILCNTDELSQGREICVMPLFFNLAGLSQCLIYFVVWTFGICGCS